MFWWILAALGSVATTVGFDLNALQAFLCGIMWGVMALVLEEITE